MTEEPQGLVSVIIPAYNAADVLERCVRSVLAQTYARFEVLLVDDGSRDGTPELADALAREDGRVRVVHKENGGVSSARNAGLDEARGEWLTFVDADDYLGSRFLESLLCGAPCDLIVGGYHTVGAHEIPEVSYEAVEARSPEVVRPLLEAHLTEMTFLCPWGKLLRTRLVREAGLRFDTGMRIGEDVVFVWTYLSRCASVALRPGQAYNYFTAPSDAKYALDGPAALDTMERILAPLDALGRRWSMDTERARCHILNYYVWLFKQYVKHHYRLSDVPRLGTFFRYPLVRGYFERYGHTSADKRLVRLLLRLRLTALLYFLIKLYY
ncbi:MAG TPA: glycosyltransferase family 2 protein [Candidatus Caccomonas pullistercoris]|nr:glycosyltransferase family 2 protein [Candidatus Caccomonas pullistercoris]